ncbi:unnamed protein product [Euphydryas editha]|uniref:Secreted protein n=1 Tax=Euphydryas editha TaxID=104508 RepID=A0AAU9TT12_EUPED|nr:unnamed protein product [Euphydryas editha]
MLSCIILMWFISDQARKFSLAAEREATGLPVPVVPNNTRTITARNGTSILSFWYTLTAACTLKGITLAKSTAVPILAERPRIMDHGVSTTSPCHHRGFCDLLSS